MTTDPSDRIQIRGLGELQHPGSCSVCLTGNCEEGYVDLDTYFDYEGQVYLCLNCAKAVARAIGFFPSDEVAFMQATAEQQSLKLSAAEYELDHLRTRVAAYDNVFSDVISRLPVSALGSLKERADEPTDDVTSAGEGELPVLTEPVKDEGPAEPVRVAAGDVKRRVKPSPIQL